MSNFYCEKCGKAILEGPNGHYVTECEHYPREGEKEMAKDYETLKSFYIAGVQFHELETILDQLAVDQRLELVLEPTNRYDPNAVRIERFEFEEGEYTMCGYVPKKFSAEISALISIGTILECVIVEVNKNAKPWEQCKVEIREVK